MVDMTNKYSVTFKAVAAQTPYIEGAKHGTSQGGHIWYVLSKNGETNSFGFSQDDKENSKGHVTGEDDSIYQGTPDKQITIQINQEQYDKLLAFGKQELGNVFNYDKYSPISNSCVSFVFKALNLIGYNPNDKKPWIAPSYDLDDIDNPINTGNLPGDIVVNGYHYLRLLTDGFEILTELLAKNGAIEVKGNNTLIPVSESRSNDIITRPYEITGYDNTHDTIIGGKGNDRLIGGNGDDILIGGNGAYSLDDDYYGSVTVRDDGDDILEGGEGHDTYYIGGKDTIIDSDGKGEIRFLDKDYKMAKVSKWAIEKGEPAQYDVMITDYNASTGLAVFENVGYRVEASGLRRSNDYYTSTCVSRETPGYFARSITMTDLATGHQVTIENFKNLDLGIGLVFRSADPLEDARDPELLREDLKKNKELIESSRQASADLRARYSDEERSFGGLVLDENHPESPYYGKPLLQNYEIENIKNCGVPPPPKLRGGPITPTPSKPEKEKNDNKVSPDKGGHSRVGTENDDIMHDPNKNADTIFDAGDGNDKIYAGDGDDTLIGGKGNDLLQGGNGKDIYVLEKGHGQDIISEFNTGKDDDTLQFNGINFNDVKFRRDNYDFILFGYNEQDSVTIKAFFANPNNQLEHFQFADRSLSLAQMQTEGITLSGTEKDDIMHDWDKTANTTFNAGDGNDKIYAGDGDDTLIGGKGNDLLQGGNGKDTYVFEKGHGQDIITEFNTSQDDDTLQFNDINFNEVKFRRDNYDLTLFGYNEQDSVTIKAFFANKNNQLERYQFADRTLSRDALTEEMMLVNNQVDRMVQAMAGFGSQSTGGVISSTQDDVKHQWQLAPSV